MPSLHDDLAREFGAQARVTQSGPHRLIHLDSPDEQTIAQRTKMVEDGSFFDDDCPVCQAQRKNGGDIVFESELESQEAPTAAANVDETIDRLAPLLWRRTYLDLDSLSGQPARTAIHGLCTGITFCLVELLDDTREQRELDRWGESLRYYSACFARYAPALCGADRIDFHEARNLGALTFQLRSYLGWFRECLPRLSAKCGDLDSVCGRLLEALRLFDEEESPGARKNPAS